MTFEIIIIQAAGSALAIAAGTFAILWIRARRECDDAEARALNLSREITKATESQLEAMQTLTMFRRQYHVAGSPLIVEFKKLRQEISRIKKRLDK